MFDYPNSLINRTSSVTISSDNRHYTVIVSSIASSVNWPLEKEACFDHTAGSHIASSPTVLLPGVDRQGKSVSLCQVQALPCPHTCKQQNRHHGT